MIIVTFVFIIISIWSTYLFFKSEDEAKAKLEKANRESIKLADTIHQMERELSQSRAECSNLRADLDVATRDCVRLNSLNHRMNADYVRKSRETLKAQAAEAVYRDENEELVDKCERLERALADAEDQRDYTSGLLCEADFDLDLLRKSYSNLREYFDTAMRSAEKLRVEAKERKSEIEELNESLSSAMAHSDELERQLFVERNSAASTETELKNMREIAQRNLDMVRRVREIVGARTVTVHVP